MSNCGTDRDEHCCYVDNKPCPFLRKTSRKKRAEGFHWSCGLRNQHGNWEDVHSDPRYIAIVKPHWDKSGVPDCGGWPRNMDAVCPLCGDS